MLLSFTLDTNTDSADQARQACKLIAVAFSLTDVARVSTPFDGSGLAHDTTPHGFVVTDGPDPATLGFGQVVPGPVHVTRDRATGALVAHQARGVTVDRDGLPWDPRIHSGGDPDKRMNKDGTWRKKKNVDPALVTDVEGELRALMAIPAPLVTEETAPPPPPAAEAVAPPPPPPAAETPAQVPPPPPPAAEAAAPPPPPAEAAATEPPTTFSQLMKWVTPRMTSGELSAVVIAETLKGLGIVDSKGDGSLGLLLQRPDLVPSAYSALSALVP